MAVAACSIVEHLDVVEDIGPGQISRFVDALFNSFFLQTAKERLGHRVIPAVAAAAHAGLKMVFSAEAQPVIAPILRALIRVDQRVLRFASPHRHQDCIEHQFASQREAVCLERHDREHRGETRAVRRPLPGESRGRSGPALICAIQQDARSTESG